MSESEILKSAELEKAQWEEAQQIEISSLDNSHVSENNDENVTKNSSNENEFLNLIDRVTIQTCEKNDNDRQKLKTTTRSGWTVRLIKKMQQSKIQEAE